MTIILFCTVLGFFVGFGYVIKKRNIRPGAVLGATIFGLIMASVLKIMKDYSRHKRL